MKNFNKRANIVESIFISVELSIADFASSYSQPVHILSCNLIEFSIFDLYLTLKFLVLSIMLFPNHSPNLSWSHILWRINPKRIKNRDEIRNEIIQIDVIKVTKRYKKWKRNSSLNFFFQIYYRSLLIMKVFLGSNIAKLFYESVMHFEWMKKVQIFEQL